MISTHEWSQECQRTSRPLLTTIVLICFDHVIYSLPGYELSHGQWNKTRLQYFFTCWAFEALQNMQTPRVYMAWRNIMPAESATLSALSFISLPSEIRLREKQCSWSDLGCVLRANSSNSRNRLVHATAVWGEIASSHCAVGQLTFISRNLRSWIHIPVLINIKLCQTHHYIQIRYQTLYQTLYQYCIVL